MIDEKAIVAKREGVRRAIDDYEATLRRELENTSRGSGHANNDFDNIKASITEVRAAKRVLWLVKD
jgi:hypothetical protein